MTTLTDVGGVAWAMAPARELREGRIISTVGWVRPNAAKSTRPKVRERRDASTTSGAVVPLMGGSGASTLTKAFWFSPVTHHAKVLSLAWLVTVSGKACGVSVTRSVTFTGAVLIPTKGEE